MVKKEIEITPGKHIDHIEPEQPYLNQALNNVTASSKAESETRYISPISVNLKDIGGHDDENVIICDSPGFGDTAGVEVDIANGYGIIQAIKECRSVRPVFLFSYKRIGDRGEGIRDLAHFLVNMVTNVREYKNSFYFIFTKFPTKTNINAELHNIKKAISKDPKDSKDEPFKLIINDMLDKTEDAKPLDPLKEKPIRLMNKLIQSECIRNPKQAFRFSITDNSRFAINEQIKQNQLSIISATKREEYRLIKHKLDELIFLKENLKEDHIETIFKDCISFLLKNIKESFKVTVDSFNRFLDRQNKFIEKDVQIYKNKLEKFKELESFKNIQGLDELIG